jgi:hypothetical protein
MSTVALNFTLPYFKSTSLFLLGISELLLTVGSSCKNCSSAIKAVSKNINIFSKQFVPLNYKVIFAFAAY